MSIPSRPDEPECTDDKSTQRDETDDSLHAERRMADGRVAHAVDALEVAADRVVDLAELRADAVLSHAREKADQGLRESGSPDDVARDRAEADDMLEDERAMAAEILRREREDSARVLSVVLPLTRKSTDRKLLTERAASDADLSYRDDFLGMVSHDLNNLLSGILGSASMLARHASETPEGQRVKKGTTRIQLCAARMKRLISDLTDVTSLSAGKFAVTTAADDGKALVAETVATFRLLAAEKRIRLEGDADDAPLVVACDRGRILQVLANLLGNAIKFTPEGGTVSARAAKVGNEVCFSVLDTGPGIPENSLQSVFERFWQAGNDDRRGLGLGLYIAKSIVAAHGGRIWVDSRVGEGSSFHFTLPSGAATLAPPVTGPGA